ncbi:Endocytosis and vacuole integrity protein, partial [Elasticomyces elasticus]
VLTKPSKSQEASQSSTQRPRVLAHKSSRSVSGHWVTTATLAIEVEFVIKTAGKLIATNLPLLIDDDLEAKSWDMLIKPLLNLVCNKALRPQLRLEAANVADGIVVEAGRLCTRTEDKVNVLSDYALPALGMQLDHILASSQNQALSDTDLQILKLIIRALESMIGSCGERLTTEWSLVLKLLGTMADTRAGTGELKCSQLYADLFRVTQFVVNDFLTILLEDDVKLVVKLLGMFAEQQADLKMSLTALTSISTIAATSASRSTGLEPFEDDAGAASDAVSGKMSWHVAALQLRQSCLDSRRDVQQAALHIVDQNIKNAEPLLGPASVSSCLSQIYLVVLKAYLSGTTSSGRPSSTSTTAAVQSITNFVTQNANKLLLSSNFCKIWRELLETYKQASESGYIQLSEVLFKSASVMLSTIRTSSQNRIFTATPVMLLLCWRMWSEFDLSSGTTITESNTSLLTEYMQLLLEILSFDIRLANPTDASRHITNRIGQCLQFARHDRYTSDVLKMSSEQGVTFKVLQMLHASVLTEPVKYTAFVVGLARKLFTISLDVASSQVDSHYAATGVKIPTFIAILIAMVRYITEMFSTSKLVHLLHESSLIDQTLELAKLVTASKYGILPANPDDQLWQAATILGTRFLQLLASIDAKDIDLSTIVPFTTNLLKSILEVSYPEARPEDQFSPSQEVLEKDQRFDIEQVQLLHNFTFSILTNTTCDMSELKEYILTLFNHSLVRVPAWNDFPRDLKNQPLESFTKFRRASVAAPKLPIRRNIHTAALECLFDL